MKILAIASSLRQTSKTQKIMNMLHDIHLPKNTFINAADINMELFRQESPLSPTVQKFREQLSDSRAVLFIASEKPLNFTYAVSAPLLNAVNWGNGQSFEFI